MADRGSVVIRTNLKGNHWVSRVSLTGPSTEHCFSIQRTASWLKRDNVIVNGPLVQRPIHHTGTKYFLTELVLFHLMREALWCNGTTAIDRNS